MLNQEVPKVLHNRRVCECAFFVLEGFVPGDLEWSDRGCRPYDPEAFRPRLAAKSIPIGLEVLILTKPGRTLICLRCRVDYRETCLVLLLRSLIEDVEITSLPACDVELEPITIFKYLLT